MISHPPQLPSWLTFLSFIGADFRGFKFETMVKRKFSTYLWSITLPLKKYLQASEISGKFYTAYSQTLSYVGLGTYLYLLMYRIDTTQVYLLGTIFYSNLWTLSKWKRLISWPLNTRYYINHFLSTKPILI